MAARAAMPAAMTGHASFRIAGLARRQRRTSIVITIEMRTSPAAEVKRSSTCPASVSPLERYRAVGAFRTIRSRPRVEQRCEQRRHHEHDTGHDREHALESGLELSRG